MAETPRSREALEKLCAFLSNTSTSKIQGGEMADLFSPISQKNGQSVEVEVSFLLSPVAHRVPLYFRVPHQVLAGTLCVVTPPPQRKYKDKVLRLSEEGNAVAQCVKKVIDAEKLAKKFADPVTMRALANSFDHFIVFAVKKYPAQLTGEFLGHQKLPVWLPNRGGFQENLCKATRTVVFPRRGHNAVTCRIGHTGLSLDQLNENLLSFLAQITSHPQATTFNNVLHIRVAGTNHEGRRVGLPIFSHTFRILREPVEEKSEPKKKKLRNESN